MSDQFHRARPVHAWTRWYWPTALVAALLVFFVPFLAGWGVATTGIGLSVGALLLGVPELVSLCTGNDQDTLSDWVWNSAHITPRPISQWNAEHVLLAGGYLLIVGCVQDYLFNLAQVYWQFWLLFGVGCYFFGVWLLGHFFERWWT